MEVLSHTVGVYRIVAFVDHQVVAITIINHSILQHTTVYCSELKQHIINQ